MALSACNLAPLGSPTNLNVQNQHPSGALTNPDQSVFAHQVPASDLSRSSTKSCATIVFPLGGDEETLSISHMRQLDENVIRSNKIVYNWRSATSAHHAAMLVWTLFCENTSAHSSAIREPPSQSFLRGRWHNPACPTFRTVCQLPNFNFVAYCIHIYSDKGERSG